MDCVDPSDTLLCRPYLEAGTLESVRGGTDSVHRGVCAYATTALYGVLTMDVFARQESDLAI